MPSFVYWRLLIYGPKGQDVAITEWKFFDSGSTQIATTGGTPLASSNNGGEGPANAFDGNTSTIWTPNPAPNFANPQWIQYQFPSAVTPATYSIQNRNATSPLWAPDSWSLQGSNDGTTWTTVGNYSAAWTSPLQTQTFTVGAYGLGDWYRILITSVASGAGNHCRVGQLVFKDASGTAISLVNGYSNASTCIIGTDNGSADAFDGLPASGQWESNNSPSVGAPEWLGYRFFASANVALFDLYAGNDFLFNNAPANFTLQRSADGGTTWTTVGGPYTAATWTQGSKQTFGGIVLPPTQRGNIDYDQIRTAVRQGTGGKFQMFGTGTPVAGHLAVYDAAGNVVDGGAPNTAAGTVTSVALSMPAEFAVAGSPVTSAGTLAVTKANEAANSVFAGPSTGAAAQPTFRVLAAADLPAGTGTVTSVGLSAPAEFTVTGSPVTSTGTLTLAKATQSAKTVYAGPTTGAAAAPAFRTLAAADIPQGIIQVNGVSVGV